MMTGIVFTFASSFAMKVFHNYGPDMSDGTQDGTVASRVAGVNALSYGLLTYLAVINKELLPNLHHVLGYTLLPNILHISIREIFQSNKSRNYKRIATMVSVILCVCSYSLVHDDHTSLLSTDHAAYLSVGILGTISILRIFLPDTMMYLLELDSTATYGTSSKQETTKTKKKNPASSSSSLQSKLNYQLKFVCQAAGVHTLDYLLLFYLLYKGMDPIEAVGYALIGNVALAVPICLFPNSPLRNSGSNVSLMYGFMSLYVYMAYKMIGL